MFLQSVFLRDWKQTLLLSLPAMNVTTVRLSMTKTCGFTLARKLAKSIKGLLDFGRMVRIKASKGRQNSARVFFGRFARSLSWIVSALLLLVWYLKCRLMHIKQFLSVLLVASTSITQDAFLTKTLL